MFSWKGQLQKQIKKQKMRHLIVTQYVWWHMPLSCSHGLLAVKEGSCLVPLNSAVRGLLEFHSCGLQRKKGETSQYIAKKNTTELVISRFYFSSLCLTPIKQFYKEQQNFLPVLQNKIKIRARHCFIYLTAGNFISASSGPRVISSFLFWFFTVYFTGENYFLNDFEQSLLIIDYSDMNKYKFYAYNFMQFTFLQIIASSYTFYPEFSHLHRK